MMNRKVKWVALMLMLCVPALATSQSRQALVIGNGDYEYFVSLKNPANDAIDIAMKLESLGFEVDLHLDATYQTMDDAVYRFGRRLEDSGAVGLFYYAGHGIEVGGRNYLIPVDRRIRDDSDVRSKAIWLDQVLDRMESARNATNIVILDACRDNPLPAGTRGGSGRGLSVIRAPVGTLVVYSTSPGDAAQDGASRNGVFTAALLDHMGVPGVDAMDMLIAVRNDVMERTRGEQVPWENSSLTGQFYFNPGEVEAEAAPARPSSSDARVGGASQAWTGVDIADLQRLGSRIYYNGQSFRAGLLGGYRELLAVVERDSAEWQIDIPIDVKRGINAIRIRTWFGRVLLVGGVATVGGALAVIAIDYFIPSDLLVMVPGGVAAVVGSILIYTPPRRLMTRAF